MISASYCTKIRDILIHSCLIFAFRDSFPEREKGTAGSDAPVQELQAICGPGMSAPEEDGATRNLGRGKQ